MIENRCVECVPGYECLHGHAYTVLKLAQNFMAMYLLFNSISLQPL